MRLSFSIGALVCFLCGPWDVLAAPDQTWLFNSWDTTKLKEVSLMLRYREQEQIDAELLKTRWVLF